MQRTLAKNKQQGHRKFNLSQVEPAFRQQHMDDKIRPANDAHRTAINQVNSSARDLWEDWDRARPFTFGCCYFNVGETHDVALAGAKFGSIDQIPEDFDEWEELARTNEAYYVRGWVAKDGRQMFLWDNFDDLIQEPRHFEQFTQGLIMLHKMKYASLRTELWDRGGERYLGLLGGLALLTPAGVGSGEVRDSGPRRVKRQEYIPRPKGNPRTPNRAGARAVVGFFADMKILREKALTKTTPYEAAHASSKAIASLAFVCIPATKS
ncbi:MAG: hypothetical protein ACRD2L_26095 [Terriglobia bacterium]